VNFGTERANVTAPGHVLPSPRGRDLKPAVRASAERDLVAL